MRKSNQIADGKIIYGHNLIRKKWERDNSVLLRGHSLNGFPSGLTLILSRPYFRCTFPCHKGHIPNKQGNRCYLAGFVQRKHAVGSMVSSWNYLNGQFL